MATSFTSYGIIWVVTSVLASILTCTSFYLPYWLTGELFNVTINFGILRRCNYPAKASNGELYIVQRCGRYTSFSDIPSTSWQVSTILLGVACAILILVALTVLLACCLKDVIGTISAKTCGILQGFAVLLILVTMFVYPAGWKSEHVIQACGSDAGSYKLGQCKISFGYFICLGAVLLSIMSVVLSLRAAKSDSNMPLAHTV